MTLRAGTEETSSPARLHLRADPWVKRSAEELGAYVALFILHGIIEVETADEIFDALPLEVLSLYRRGIHTVLEGRHPL